MPKWIRIAVILLLLGAGSAKAAQGQQVELRDAVWPDTSNTLGVSLSWPEHRQAEFLGQSRVAQESFFSPQEFEMFTRKRSWWMYPLIGAVVGGLTFTYITYRECQKEDCIFPIGLPLVGVALGATGGLAVEGIIRVVK